MPRAFHRFTERLTITLLVALIVTTIAVFHIQLAGGALSHSARQGTSPNLIVTPPPCSYIYCISAASTWQGFDICQPPTTSQMQNWWNGTPYGWANLYIGGLNWGCRPLPSYVNTSWVQAVHNQGWELVPTWVSYQAPCADPNYGAQMSSNTGTAYNQGYNEASSAASTAQSLGIGGYSIIYDDMEYFSGSSSCYNAVAAFINGWSTELYNLGFSAGVYENVGAGDLQDLCNRSGSITEPSTVWIAYWNGSQSTTNIPGLNNGCWDSHQRLHQYNGGVCQTWNGTYLCVDQDSADGRVTTH